MNHWNRFWFSDVPKIRCQLLITSLAIGVAFDCWINFLPQAALHGITDFHVAHFGILDKLPFAPSAGLYAGLQISVGFLLLAGLWSPYRRWLHLAACGLYTWGWMMSQLDSFQHHYFLSLALLCIAVLNPQDPRRHPYKLLGVIIAVVYFFTAIAKLEPLWLSGFALRSLGESSLGENQLWLKRLVEWLTASGFTPAAFWSFLAVGVIVAEVLLAGAYLCATIWPRPTGRGAQLAACGALLLAVATHLSIEAFQLKIGWFSYYMLILAVVFFTPASWLETISSRLVPRLSFHLAPAPLHLAAAAFTAILFLATCILSANLVEYRLLRAAAWLEKGAPQQALDTLDRLTLLDAYQPSERKLRLQRARLAAYRGLQDTEKTQALVNSLRHHSNLPVPLRMELAAEAIETQDLDTAIAQLTAVLDEQPHHFTARAQLGYLHLQRGQVAEAETQLRQVLELRPFHLQANDHLGTLLVLSNRAAEAVPYLQRVLELQPDHGQAHYYLAITCDLAGDLVEAKREYILALTYHPQLHDARLNLAKVMLGQGQSEAALEQLQRIPPEANCYPEAKLLLSELTSP